MWEITISQQIYSIIYSLLVGVVFSIVYDVLKSFCVLNHSKKIFVFFKDIIFSVFAAFVVFLLFIARCNGAVRGYIIFFVFVGFTLFKCIFSKYWLKLLCRFWIITFKSIKCLRRLFLSFSLKLEQTEAFVIIKLKEFLKKVNIIRKNS